MSKFKSFETQQLDHSNLYQIVTASVIPRPIALVSSYNKKGEDNLAPFSFFNTFSINPLILGFSPIISPKTEKKKDTLVNIEETKECVVQVVTFEMANQINIASGNYERNENEFSIAGFTPIDSDCVKAKRVAESPIQFECGLNQIVKFGDQGFAGHLILMEVKKIHVLKELIELESELVKSPDIIGRNGFSDYVRLIEEAVFSMPRFRK